jgi:transposase
MTNSTRSRCNNTVSTVKKSTASTLVAWVRKNCRQVSAERLGAGSTPARCRMVHTRRLTTRWSSGPIDDRVKHIKMVKRQKFGRAGLQLPRKRVLLTASGQ